MITCFRIIPVLHDVILLSIFEQYKRNSPGLKGIIKYSLPHESVVFLLSIYVVAKLALSVAQVTTEADGDSVVCYWKF